MATPPHLPMECHWCPAPGHEDMASVEPGGPKHVVLSESRGRGAGVNRPWGLRDEEFEQRRPLRGQITKREVRAVSLYYLGLRPDSVVWDIGAGTGSISVEAAAIAHRGKVFAIERDLESIQLLKSNVARYGGGNVEIVTGAAPQALEGLSDPDAVFVGGSGGNLNEILAVATDRIKAGGCIVANFATLERTNETYRWFQQNGLCAEISMINASRGKAMPDESVRLEALNPVFIVSAWRQGRSPEALPDEQRNN